MTFYSCEQNPVAGALIDLVNSPSDESEQGLIQQRDILQSFFTFEVDYWSKVLSPLVPNHTWKTQMGTEAERNFYKNKGSQICLKQKEDSSSILKSWFEDEMKRDPILFSFEPMECTWKTIIDANQIRYEKELLKSWTPIAFNAFEWLRSENANSRFKGIELQNLYATQILPEMLKSEQGMWWTNDFDTLPLHMNCHEFEKKQGFVYKPWMNPQLNFMKRDTEKRLQSLSFWSKGSMTISRKEAMNDHIVFQILENLSAKKNKWETIQYKTPSFVIRRELYDLKILFLFTRYMEWYFSRPVSSPKEEEEKINHSYFIDIWKMNDANSFNHWDNQWNKQFEHLSKNEEDINKIWSFNPEQFTDFTDTKKRLVRVQLHPLALIINVVSFMYDKFQPQFWQCIHAIHEWICRPKPECYRKRLTALFPLTLEQQFGAEKKRWDYLEDKCKLNDTMLLILERYGFMCIDENKASFIDNPLFSFENRNRICMPEAKRSVSLDGYIDSVIPLQHWSRTEVPAKIHTSLANRAEKLFKVYYGENVMKIMEYFSLAYITMLWTLYGKFYEGKDHSNFVQEFRSIEFSRHLVAQYQHWDDKSEPMHMYPVYSLVFAPNDFLFGTMLNYVGKGNFFQNLLSWTPKRIEAEQAFYERVKQMQHHFCTWYASYRKHGSHTPSENDKKSGAIHCELKRYFAQSLMDQFITYHRNTSPLCLKSTFLDQYLYLPAMCRPGPTLTSASEAFNQNIIRHWKKLVECSEFIDRIGLLDVKYLDQPSEELKETLEKTIALVQSTQCF